MRAWLLAAVTAGLLILAFPGADLHWLAPLALAPLLVAAAAQADPLRRFQLGWGAGIVYWFGVCYWIQFVLAVHGGVGQAAAWAMFLAFCLIKGLHLGVYALLLTVLANLYVIYIEEPGLEKRFGEDYRAYRAATPRWLPFRRSKA